MRLNGVLRQRRGFALMTILLVATLFIALAGAVGSEILTAQGATRTRLGTSRARFAAYAGLQHVVLLLKENPAYNTNLVAVLMPGSDNVSYTVEITNNSGSDAAIDAPDGTEVPGRTVYCSAMGADGSQAEVSLHAMSGVVSAANPTLNYGAFSDQSVQLLGNSKSLSFDSSAHSYTTNANNQTVPTVTGMAGNLGTNRSIKVDSPEAVFGDIYRPAASTPASPTGPTLDADAMSDSNLQAGLAASVGAEVNELIDLPNPVDLPKYSAPAAYTKTTAVASGTGSLAPEAGDTLVRSRLEVGAGDTMTLHGGRYFFPKGVKIDGVIAAAADVEPGNPIVIFVGKDAELGPDSQVNVGGLPSNVQVYFVNKRDGDQKFKMVGNSQFFGTVAGNRVQGDLSENAQLFGGFMGRSMKADNNAEIVFDETLKDAPLHVQANWGLNGVTEPEPEIVMAKSLLARTYVQEVRLQSVVYKPPVGKTKAILEEELEPAL